MIKNGIFVLVLCLSFLSLNAQNGHLNLGNLLESLPEMKAANSKIESLQKSLAEKDKAMIAAFQQKSNVLNKKYRDGGLSEIDAKKEAEKLKAEEKKIIAFEQDADQQIQNKRRELLQPILKKIDIAIKEVAKEKGYKMIFDTSVFNALLYAKDSDDIMALVKAKL